MNKFEQAFVRPRPGRTLIVGSHVYPGREDRRALYPDAVGVDMQEGPGVDIVMDLEDPTAQHRLPLFDHIECCSVLEHAKRPWLMAETLEAVMKPGATIFIMAPLIWRLHGYPSDYWRMTPHALDVLFPRITWKAKATVSNDVRQPEDKLPQRKFDNWSYIIRTETAGFGVREQ